MLETSGIVDRILDLTQQHMYAEFDNVYKNILRQLINIFGNLYYINENNEKTKVHCSTGRQERLKGKSHKGNTLVLPYITITEISSNNNDSRRRYTPVLIHEKYWDEQELRAKRVISLPPRPVDMTYQINIWTKYMEDMDVLRSSVFSLFNPDLELKTSFSDYNRAFIESEGDIDEVISSDGKDRTLKRSFVIKIETYIPAPKFLYTNTGEIERYVYDVDVY